MSAGDLDGRFDFDEVEWSIVDETHSHRTADLAAACAAIQPVELTLTVTTALDRESYERLLGYRPAFEGEIFGGPLDGLPVQIYEP